MKVKLVNLGNMSTKGGILRVEENSYVLFDADGSTVMCYERYKTLAGAKRKAVSLGMEVVSVEEFGAVPA